MQGQRYRKKAIFVADTYNVYDKYLFDMNRKLLAGIAVFAFVVSAHAFEQKTFTVKGVEFTMVKIPAASFKMGATEYLEYDAAANEKPVFTAWISTFYLGKYEVTQALWEAVMGSNPSHFTGDENLPVESVSYNDCLAFIAKLNEITGEYFRLPTEAEWECAAKGRGLKGNDYFYDKLSPKGDFYKKTSKKHTYPVINTSENQKVGINGLAGNVQEWCSDWMGNYYQGNKAEPKGPKTGKERVCRGGGWDDPAKNCRVSARNSYAPDYSAADLGFRLALSVNPPKKTPTPAVKKEKKTNEVNPDGAIEEEAIPCQLVEVKPSFMGGDEEVFARWVNERLRYPEAAKANRIQGRVWLQFVVGADGKVSDVKVFRGVDPSLDKEAVRVVESSPDWTPGRQGDHAVSVFYTFPIIFQLR